MNIVALLLLAIGSLAAPAWSADDLMSSQLVDEARQWQQKGREDLAAELWRKLLRTDPAHPEALVKLGVIEARAGNIRQAEDLHSRATKLAKPPAGLTQLSIALSGAKGKSTNVPTPPAMQERTKPVEQAVKTTLSPRVKPPSVAPGLKARVPLAAAAQNTASPEKASKSADADTLHLQFSTSIDLVR